MCREEVSKCIDSEGKDVLLDFVADRNVESKPTLFSLDKPESFGHLSAEGSDKIPGQANEYQQDFGKP